jgi:hypothetical chaperone protein
MRPISGGIDFGTSNSTVGVMEGNEPRLVALEENHVTMPSAIFFNFEDDQTYFGRRAIADYAANAEGRLLRALKSVLGSSLIHEKTRVKTRQMAFSEIISGFLGHLKARLDLHAGESVERVVLGRPVHFVDENADADRDAQDQLEKAAREQGFKDIAFQFEPIAAALDYERSVNREELALIVDIGGGTSDFSIVRVSPERARAVDRKDDILANRGVHIGGTDFDRLLSVAHLMPELGYGTPTRDGKRNLPVSYFVNLATWQRIHQLYTPKAMSDLRQIRYEAERPELVERMIDVVQQRQGHALAGKVEQAKIDLTDQPLSTIDVRLSDETLNIPVTRAELDETIAIAVGRIVDVVGQTLHDAQVPAERITTLFLTGGSTAIGLLRQSICDLSPSASVVNGDVFGSVGLGLTLDARRKFG